ncbi:unnamed protein product [Lathyrus oleraceus]
MDSGGVSDADNIDKRRPFYESSKAWKARNLKRKKKEKEVRRSFTPLSFYKGPTTYHPGPMCNGRFAGKQFVPLSLYTTTVYQPDPVFPVFPVCEGINSSESKMFPVCEGINSSESIGNKSSESIGKNSSESIGNKSSESKVSRNSISDHAALSILSKLPVKSLKRFGCVRKSWSVLFENSDFMTMYTNHFVSHDYHTYILSNDPDQPEIPPFLNHSEFHLLHNTIKFNLPPPFPYSDGHVSILGSTSVNGIFCLGKTSMENQYVLWNPATDKFRRIPSSPTGLIPKCPQSNLNEELFFHAFGYDKLRDDFKIIQYVSSFVCCSRGFDRYYSCLPAKSYFEIYSLKTNSWRMFDMANDLSHWSYPPPFDGLELYLDGACHWLVTKYHSSKHVETTLLTFHLSDEVFFTTPIGESSYTLETRLMVLNGSIAFFSNHYGDTVFHISILGELGVSQSWIKLYISDPFPPLRCPPIGFGNAGCIFFTKTNSTEEDYELAYLDLSTQKTQIIKDHGITLGKKSYFRVGLYKESLFPIGGSSH